MKALTLILPILLACTGCATTNVGDTPNLSGSLSEITPDKPGSGPKIGFVADSQLQTRKNFALVPGYRGRLEDSVVRVSIRPPALDWAARSLLKSNLASLKAEGAKAIFYLGDGANNGCYDEFAEGFEDGSTPLPNDQGILALLDNFRKQAGIPIFFALGNHDILGAGSTAKKGLREDFCEDKKEKSGQNSNRALSKLQVISLVDQFNRSNQQFTPEWDYHSSYDLPSVTRSCGSNPKKQHRRWGCYLAARVDYKSGKDTIQFLLLDSNDWYNVSKSKFFGLQLEGIRGAMSYGDKEKDGVVSQTRWFDDNASQKVPMRVAVSHYDLQSLKKHIPVANAISKKSQQVMKIFTKGQYPRDVIQDHALVVTAHTHAKLHGERKPKFSLDCNWFYCKTNGDRFSVSELNIGSTTDYSNYATLAQFEVSSGAVGYKRVESEPDGCSDVYVQVKNHNFPRKFLEIHKGWGAIGLNENDPFNYRKFKFDDLENLWANLDEFAGSDQHRANCIGLYAAALEIGVNPLNRLPPGLK